MLTNTCKFYIFNFARNGTTFLAKYVLTKARKEEKHMIIRAARVQHTDRLSEDVTVTSWGWTIEIDGKVARDADGDIIYFSVDRSDVTHEIARLIRLAWDNYHEEIEEEE
jgi:hypothetical protein